MKKILSIALVALLATSAVFAGLSGKAVLNLGANFDNGAWGFANSKEFSKLTIVWQSETVEKVAEGELYAGIKASFDIKTEQTQSNFGKALDLKINANISEAYITDGEFKVSILGSVAKPDYATSVAIDGANNKVTYSSSYAAAPGIKVTYGDSTLGFGAAGNWKTGVIDWSVFSEDKNIALAEGLTMDLATAISDNTEYADSIKIAYEGAFKASVAADLGWTAKAKNFDFDIAANASYDKYTLDAYYWYSKKNLAAKAVAELDPATITVTAKDILGKKDLSVSATKTIDAVSLTVAGGYNIGNKTWNASVDATYTAADLYTAKGKVKLSDNAKNLVVEASAESSNIIAGATLKAAYVSSNLLQKGFGKIDTSCTIAF